MMRFRRALAAASLVMLAGTSLLAGRASGTVIYTCGTIPGLKPAEGRLTTWNLSTLQFSPGGPSKAPLMIRYKSITRLEYGRSLPRRPASVEAPVIPCLLKRQDNYLTIFFEEGPADEDENQDRSQSKDPRHKETQDQKDRRDRAERRTRTDRTNRTDQKDQTDLTKKEQYAVFNLGDGELRPTLRIIETRSGKRIKYQDAGARKAAR